MPKSISIFLSENNSLDQVLEIFSNTLNAEKFKKELSKVFAKIYNNYVGYYLFRDSEIYYKIFILPKHIKEPRNNSDDERRTIDEFIGYLTTFRQQNLDLFNGFITGVCKIHPEYICQYIRHCLPQNILQPSGLL